MKYFQDVHGSDQAAQPLIIGKDTVYVHENIRTEQIEDIDGQTRTEWVYDEYQYPISEIQAAMAHAYAIQGEQFAAKTKLLEAKIAAQTDRAEFVEDCIAEMAIMIYV